MSKGPSSTTNTAFVERINLDWRLWDAHLSRKSVTFAKSVKWLDANFAICVAHYNFVRPHEPLSRQVDRKFIPTTPAMKGGIVDSQWETHDLLDHTACQL